MATNITIRAAGQADVTEIAALWGEMLAYHALIPGPSADQGFAEFLPDLLERDDAHVLVAVDVDHAVGYGITQIKTRPSFVRNRRYGFISDLAVTASHRRQGVGTALLRALCQELEAAGVNQVEVGIQMQNEMSRAFWKKHGFEDVKMTVARKLTSADS